MSARTVPRAAAVAAVLATSATWTPARRRADGKRFFIIAGTKPGAVYYAASDGCTCPAAQHSRDGRCKHTAAVLEHERSQRQVAGAEHAATVSPTSWRPCSRGCGELLAPEHVGRMCDSCFTRIARALEVID